MKRLKSVIDPANLLNPGIIITEDKRTHVHNLKTMPVVEEEVDKCIECGFCEQHCPSRDITTTPRRRIVIRRAVKRLEDSGNIAEKKAILKDYDYDGLETCAVDGMCATQCPVNINTGDLVKRLRRENHSAFQNGLAVSVARHFRLFEGSARSLLKTGFFFNRVFGKNFMRNFTRGVKKIVPAMPLWSNQLRRPGKKLIIGPMKGSDQQVIYFSTCISRMMGGDIGQQFLSVCRKAGIDVIVPGDIKGSCCGQVFSSKGFEKAFRLTANETVKKLWKYSDGGKIAIITDVTSCTQTLRTYRNYLSDENRELYDKMNIMDLIDFAAEKLLPRLKISRPKGSVVFHPVCSVHKMGSMGNLQLIGKACAQKADIPFFSKCCGMAGDRGFYFPELTASATRPESNEVRQSEYEGYYSTSTTCEIALSEAVGKNYESILKLLDEVADD
jgi:D-lactate dehydrogenase